MKPKTLLIAAGLLAVVAGCTTTPVKVSRVPVKADAHFTIAHFEPSQVDVPAKLTKMAPPRVRMRSAEEGPDGYAIVQFIVDADGIPREVQWVEASDELFASLAATSIAETRYSPAKKGGKPVATKMVQRCEFRSVRAFTEPWNYPRGNQVGETSRTNYTEEGVNPKTQTYYGQGGGDGRSFWH